MEKVIIVSKEKYFRYIDQEFAYRDIEKLHEDRGNHEKAMEYARKMPNTANTTSLQVQETHI